MQVVKTSAARLFILYSLAILLLVFSLYYLGLRAPFQFDDIANITKNFSIRNYDIYSEIMSRSRWFGELTNKLYFQLAGFNPLYYRIFNILCHMSTGLSWLGLCYLICKKQKIIAFVSDNAFLLTNTSFALFMLHPVQTQTVSYIIQARLEGLATLFITGSLFLFFSALFSKSNFYKIILFSLSVLALFFGCGSKEIAVVTPILAILIDLFWFSDFSWEKFKPRLLYHLFYFLFTMFVMFHLLKPTFFKQLLSFGIESFNNRGNILTSNPMQKITAYQFLISEFSVMLHYLWIYIFPISLCVEYNFVLHSSIFDSVVLIPFFILVAISSFFLWLIKHKEYRPLSFGYFWFLIATLPRTTIIPSAELACDYKTYLASFGMFWMISFFIVKSCDYLSKFNFSINSIEKIRNSVIIFILAACTHLTFHRNKVWADAADFWKDIVLKNPGKPRPLNNYAVALTEKGEFDEAVKMFKESIALDPYYPDPLSNLAVVLSNQEKYNEAIESLNKSLEIIPDYPEAYNNLAAIFIKKNDIDRAIVNLKKAISLRPFYGKAYFNLGRCYIVKEEKELAWQQFKKATEGDFDTTAGFVALGESSIMIGKYHDAIKAFNTSIEKGESSFGVYFNLAHCHFMLKDFANAEYLFKELVKAAPTDGCAKFNLAETLFVQDKFSQAYDLFLEFKPFSKEAPKAICRIANCLEKIHGIEESLSFLEDMKVAEFTEEGKELFRQELGRTRLQARINSGNNSVNSQEMNELFSI